MSKRKRTCVASVVASAHAIRVQHRHDHPNGCTPQCFGLGSSPYKELQEAMDRVRRWRFAWVHASRDEEHRPGLTATGTAAWGHYLFLVCA